MEELVEGIWKLCRVLIKWFWGQTDLMDLRFRIEEGMTQIAQNITFAPAEISEDTHGCACFKCCVGKTGGKAGNDMVITQKLSNYGTTFSIINSHLEKLKIKTMKRTVCWPKNYFVLKDDKTGNSDWQILSDKFKDISNFVAEPGVRLVLYASLRRELKELLLECLDLIEEIIFACHDADKHVGNDIGWFEARCSLYGDGEYKEYYDLERPKEIAEELQAVLKNHPSKKNSSPKVLFVDFPWGWPNLKNELWDREKSLGVPCELYQLDYKSWTFSKCKRGCDPGEEGSWEKKDAKGILFDTVICWHFMQHCSKIYSKLCYRKIINTLKRDNGLLILFLAVSRDPKIDTIAIEKSCEYTAFHAEKLLGKKIADPCKTVFDANLSSVVTKVDEGDGQIAPAAWQIVLDGSIYGYWLKCQNDDLIYWKHPEDVIQAGAENISSLSAADRNKATELFKKEKLLDNKFPSEIEIIRHDGKVILKYFDTPFLCYAYTPRHSPDVTPAEETEDIVNTLWTTPNKPLCYFDRYDDGDNPEDNPFFSAMKKYKLEKCRGYCKREFFRGKSEKTALSIDVFLHGRYDFDTEAYVRFQYVGNWYVTYFPTLVYMNERLAYEKLCACERDGEYAGSVTHQISQKTLERRLADNKCRLQKIWYHNLGPRAASDPDMKQMLSQSRPADKHNQKNNNNTKKIKSDSRSVYSVLTGVLNKSHSGLTLPGKFSAKKKLLEWDVHDAMVVAYKNDSV